jgi:hypothetical protein
VKKEVLIAIIIGFGLGLVITFGIWTANKALKKVPPTPAPPEEAVATPTPAPEELSLIITSPEDESISAEEKIEVVGKTALQATVVILYQEGEKIIQADGEGNFSSEITLVGGSNQIEITAYDQDGNEVGKTINVVYSTAEI